MNDDTSNFDAEREQAEIEGKVEDMFREKIKEVKKNEPEEKPKADDRPFQEGLNEISDSLHD